MDEDSLFGVFDDGGTKRKIFQKPPADGSTHGTSSELTSDPAAGAAASASGDGPTAKKARVALEPLAPIVPAPAPAATTAIVPASKLAAGAEAPKETKPAVEEEEESFLECAHTVSLPPSRKDEPEAPYLEMKDVKNPARTYPFTLDPFQRVSVACLEREESVLVSAHTSAGKTVVAEYAIAMALRDRQRVIYTSPIKALSNQKYRELFETFADVGLMTGDVTINPAASCLVMTTEILRSMLYRGSEILREVKWVIFDEIHYMRDKERGVVWEETIILLPDKVRYVFLSATIPNAKEFTDWIAKIHNQVCHVVYTDRRPVPLQHYVFPANGDGLHLVVDEKSVFREENFTRALAQLASSPQEARERKKKLQQAGKNGQQSDIYKIVKMIMERRYEPVIVFAFSKKECEFLALQMSKLDFNTDDEKTLIDSVFRNAIDCLSEDDKQLPQIAHIIPLLRRGIGIHHSGLLPILKEVIEILFQEGLLKALFATETFSIGLNMPARTVVFTSVRKFDGANFRWISGGEYIQMSGRAGRRGKDERGIVILCVDEKMEPQVARGMLKGHADALNSSFHLSYNMLLNLLRVEGCDPEALISRSFHQFQHDHHVPQLQQQLATLQTRTEQLQQALQLSEAEQGQLEEYHLLRSQLEQLKEVLREAVMQPIHILPFITPGRLIRVQDQWGVVVNYQKKPQTGAVGSNAASVSYIIDALLPASVIRDGGGTELDVVPVTVGALQVVSSLRVYLPKDLRTKESRLVVERSLREVAKRFPDGIPLLDPIEDIRIDDEALLKLIKKIELLEESLSRSAMQKHPRLQALYANLLERKKIENDAKELRKRLRASDNVVMKDELKAMKRVLRRLGYISAEGVIELKGKVACEINAGDELLLSELMFNGHFNDLTPEQCAALLSCTVFQEKSSEPPKLAETLSAPLLVLQDTARKIARVAQESKLTINTEEYVQSFRPHIMEVVYAWAKGAKFMEICKMTDIFEGSIIRCMRRLEELLKQMCAAAKAIGNSDLESKFADSITKIKRDIVFAASLYL
jgi:ATP-dependent RNA helicase DOB1